MFDVQTKIASVLSLFGQVIGKQLKFNYSNRGEPSHIAFVMSTMKHVE
jgi:hypothetical protein